MSFKKGYKPWNTGKTLSEKTKKKISKTMTGKTLSKEHIKNRTLSQIGLKRTDETKLKMSKIKKGENNPMFSKTGILHPRWIKDRTKLKKEKNKMNDSAYMSWSYEVKKRDNWKCKINNCDCKGRLESHHILSWIDYPKLRYDVNNGITLCYYHHPRKRKDVKNLALFFKELIVTNR